MACAQPQPGRKETQQINGGGNGDDDDDDDDSARDCPGSLPINLEY